MLEAEGPECFPRLSTVGREKTKSLFVPCEIKEKDEKLHTLFIQNKGELLGGGRSFSDSPEWRRCALRLID